MYENHFQSWAIFQCRLFSVHPHNRGQIQNIFISYFKYLDSLPPSQHTNEILTPQQILPTPQNNEKVSSSFQYGENIKLVPPKYEIIMVQSKMEQKGMTFDNTFCYFILLFSSLSFKNSVFQETFNICNICAYALHISPHC